jgi:hypothetical protein
MHIIKILRYDPVKGKGEYLNPDGKTVTFRYKMFAGRMIGSGKLARIINNKIDAATKPDSIKWIFHRITAWFTRKISRK